MSPRVLLFLAVVGVAATVIVGAASGGLPPEDTTPPTVTITITSDTEADGPTGATLTYTATANDDVDGSLTPTCTGPASGSAVAVGSTVSIDCEATDIAGNTGNASASFTAVDTTGPVVTPPGNVSAAATSGDGAAVSYPNGTATDLVSGSVPVTCAPPSGSTFALGVHTVTCSATDGAGNPGQATFTVTVQDLDAPLVSPPSDRLVEATGPAGAAVTYGAASAIDPPSNAAIGVTCGPPASGSTFSLGTTTVTCTSAPDGGGLVGTGSFQVTVVDTTPPTVIAPPNTTAAPTSASGAVVSYPAATATDLVDTSVGVSCSPASGSLFPIGVTTVNCTGTDDSGNSASSSFSVSVQDAQAPVLTMPPSRTVEANRPNGSLVTYETPTAIDAVDGPIIPTCTRQSGTVFPIGVTLVNCTAIDTKGHVGGASFTISVVDTTPPVLTLPANRVISSTTGVPATDPRVRSFLTGATATDIADRAPTITTNAPDVFQLGTTRVVFTAVDAAGNKEEGSATVTITPDPIQPGPEQDTTPPQNVRKVKARLGNLSVAITWKKPKEDVDHVRITRTAGIAARLLGEEDVEQTEVLVYEGKGKRFVDRGLRDGVEYRYVVVTYDKAGNRSAGVAVLVVAERRALVRPVNGSVVSGKVPLVWRAIQGAEYYNIQLWYKGKKRQSIWPKSPRYTVPKVWKFEGKRFKLKPGEWHVFVWPFMRGSQRYGDLHVDAGFIWRKR